MKTQLNTTFNHLFRTEYSKLVSFLTVKFGPSKIDLIEDAVQESLLKAMRLWSYTEIPDNPGKWLYRTSYNSIIDTLRREQKTILFNPELMSDYLEENYAFQEGGMDEQLKMIFACCHPSMNESDKLMLSLKLLCGFSNNEIGRALLKNKEAVKKGVFRAKEKFKSEIGNLEIPPESGLPDRLSSVLKVIYLLFNNGYTAYEGDQVLNKDVCEEALRLAGMLYVNEHCNTSELRALIALMSFNLSRFDARVNADGQLVAMEDQDRSRWDYSLIDLGARFIAEAQEGNKYSKFHLEAAIAREYAISKTYETIDWKSILTIYDALVEQSQNELLALNRLVVLAKVKGDALALSELNEIHSNTLKKNHYFYSIKGSFEKNLGLNTYKDSLSKAIELTNNLKEKQFLQSRLEE